VLLAALAGPATTPAQAMLPPPGSAVPECAPAAPGAHDVTTAVAVARSDRFLLPWRGECAAGLLHL
jgi:hypothetical protein